MLPVGGGVGVVVVWILRDTIKRDGLENRNVLKVLASCYKNSTSTRIANSEGEVTN